MNISGNTLKDYYFGGEDRESVLSGDDEFIHEKLLHVVLVEFQEVNTARWPFNDVQKKRLGRYISKMFAYIRENSLMKDQDIQNLKMEFTHASDYRTWKVLKGRVMSPVLSYLGCNVVREYPGNVRVYFHDKIFEL